MAEIIIILASVFTAITYWTIIYMHSYYLLIKKGFSTHIAISIVGLTVFAGFLSPVIPIWLELGEKNETLCYCLFAFFSVPMALFVYARYISEPPKRRFGKRDYKPIWKIAGILLSLTSACSIIYFLYLLISTWIDTGFVDAYEKSRGFMYIFIILSPFARLFFNYEDLFQHKSIEHKATIDERPPVLFIRSFAMDTDPFFWGNIPKKNEYVSTDLLAFKENGSSGNLTFQQYFSKAINDHVGPLIGLGDPTRYFPLEGLVSTYYQDENWQDSFKNWVNKAGYIISVPGNTQGLQFELNYILNNGLADRFFIFTPPADRRPLIQRKTLKLSKWVRAVEKFDWINYCSTMQSIGYQVQQAPPQPGTVIGFSQSGKQRILVVDARYPLDFVQPMQIELKNAREN